MPRAGWRRHRPTFLLLAIWSLAWPAHATSELYDQLNARGRSLADQAMQRALEERLSNESEIWKLASGGSGSVQPLKTWLSTSGHFCRSFEEIIRLAPGKVQIQRAIGCRDDGGVWKRVEK